MKPRGDYTPGLDFFEDLAEPAAGWPSRSVRIGPFSIRLDGIPPDVEPALSDHYLGFISEPLPEHDLTLEFRRASVDQFLDPRIDPRRYYVQRPDGNHLLIHGIYFGGWFERDGSSALLSLCRDGWSGLRVPLELFLRAYCAWSAIHRNGFLLHAASLLRDGKVYVFFGHSGVGKTTVSRLSAEDCMILSDDMTLITQEKKGFMAHSVPFRGPVRERQVTERHTYPIAGLYQLVQASKVKLEALDRPRAAAAVLSCMPFVTDPMIPANPAQTMNIVERAARQIPVFRLEFTRSAEFWEAVLAKVR